MSDEKKSVWETLRKIDVSEHTEQKNGLTYLSWAWAWGALKDHYPSAAFEKHSFEGLPYVRDENGNAFVSVSITVEAETCTETMPVLDYRNKAVKDPDSFQVNTSLQRCLAKAISYHGLGHYIYAGEDLPPASDEADKVDKVDEADEVLDEVVDEEREAIQSVDLEDSRDSFLEKKFIDASSPPGFISENLATDEGLRKLIPDVVRTFMPSSDDKYGNGKRVYKNQEATEKGVLKFWKDNVTTMKMLEENDPTLYEQVVKMFGAAKKSAKNGEAFKRN